jgi:outer membrane immunogenic protein
MNELGDLDRNCVMKIRNSVLGLTLTGALALSALPANAADLSPGGYKDSAPPVTVWSGFYGGVNLGYGWGNEVLDYNPTVFTGVNPGGALGGGQIGYNWQAPQSFSPYGGYGSLVYGIEADLQGSDIGAKTSFSGSTFKSDLDYFGTVRGRIGYATDRTLYYATGGLAYGGLTHAANITGTGNFTTSTTATGYVVGAGIEMMTSRAWSIKAEYKFIDFGMNDPSSPTKGAYTANGGVSNGDEFHTFSVGLNYHVGAGYVPLK